MIIHRKKQDKQFGFTYVEFLLYISITTVMLLAIGGVFMNILSGKEKFIQQDTATHSAQYIFEDVARSLQSAQSISVPTIGVTSTNMSLIMNNPAGNPTTYTMQSGALIKKSADTEVTLTPFNLKVDSLTFERVTGFDAAGVRVMLTLSASSSSAGVPQSLAHTVTTTVFLRTTQ